MGAGASNVSPEGLLFKFLRIAIPRLQNVFMHINEISIQLLSIDTGKHLLNEVVLMRQGLDTERSMYVVKT